MYTDHYGTTEYPHFGMFYTIGIDDSKPLDQQTEEEIEVFSTILDLGDGTSLNTDTFKVFFPFDAEKETLMIYGMEQKGRVIGIYPSQLGGCTVLLTRI